MLNKPKCHSCIFVSNNGQNKNPTHLCISNNYTPAKSIRAKHPPLNKAVPNMHAHNQGTTNHQYHHVTHNTKTVYSTDCGKPPLTPIVSTNVVYGNKNNPTNRTVKGWCSSHNEWMAKDVGFISSAHTPVNDIPVLLDPQRMVDVNVHPAPIIVYSNITTIHNAKHTLCVGHNKAGHTTRVNVRYSTVLANPNTMTSGRARIVPGVAHNGSCRDHQPVDVLAMRRV